LSMGDCPVNFLGACSSLKILVISDAPKLGAVFKELAAAADTLELLKVSSCNVSVHDAFATIPKFKKLSALEIQTNSDSVGEFDFSVVEPFPETLVDLQLDCGRAFSTISYDFLRNCKNLASLDTYFVRSLHDFSVFKNHQEVAKSLREFNIPITVPITEENLEAFCCLENLTSLDGLARLAKAWYNNKFFLAWLSQLEHLETLYLTKTLYLTDEAFAIIADPGKELEADDLQCKLKNLKRINLWNNKTLTKGKGFEALVKLMRLSKDTLEKVYFPDGMFSSSECQEIIALQAEFPKVKLLLPETE
jgi:hypothetical protein